MNSQTNPDTFKALILAQHPDGISSDGRRYADIPSTELTQKVVDKYPDGVTADGRRYADFLNKSSVSQNKSSTGSAGEAQIPGSTLGSNLKALGSNILGGIRAFGSATGANAIGEGIGTAAANIGLLAQGKNPNIPVNIPKMAGGILTAGATAAGAGLPIGTAPSALARVGQAAAGYGALGGIAGAGNALQNNNGAGGVLKSAAIGAGLGAAGGAIGQSAGEALSALKSPLATGVRAVGQDAKDIRAIQENIAPKLTLKEQRLALSEGRIIPGQDPTMFKGGTADQVIPSAKQTQAAIVIRDNIPGAVQMKQPELYSALSAKTTEMAQKLRPVMESTPITQDTIQQITDAWDTLKTAQSNDPYLPSEANLSKLQQQFETKFLQGSRAKNMNDLWETRKAYDLSVPANVKSATINSTDALQAQKTIWIQNRNILNDAINNTSTGLGKTSQKAFSDMSYMYEAQKGIQSSIKVIKEGAPSRYVQFVKKHKYAAGAVGYIAAKHIPGVENLIP